jgi:hypothetical protein
MFHATVFMVPVQLNDDILSGFRNTGNVADFLSGTVSIPVIILIGFTHLNAHPL